LKPIPLKVAYQSGGPVGAAWKVLALFFLCAPLLATTYSQPGFSESVIFTGLVQPTAIRFLPDGSVLVTEKSGLIKKFPNLTTNTYTVVADLTVKVHNFWDRGLLNIAVDPNFSLNNYIYVIYSQDAKIGGTPPLWGPGDGISDPCPTPPGPTTDGCVISGHVSRLTATGPNWGDTEEVLIEDWCQQFPSHSIGSLAFGADGYLYVTGGEGANFNNMDWGQWGGTSGTPPYITPANPCGDPPFPIGTPQTQPTAEGGALRAQSHLRTAGEPRVLNGSLLRIDPATGAAAPGNPLGGSSDANEQRIIAYGLRNPFRMIVKPGTNDVWIADVGWNAYEEINHVPDLTQARNFGWPCFEGDFPQYTGLNICPTQAQTVLPFFVYSHSASVVPGDGCPTGSSSITGMAFYGGASNYPSNFVNGLFFSDYSRKCMWIMFPDTNGNPDPTNIGAFAFLSGGDTDLQIGPDGNLYYVDYDNGRIMQVRYGLAAVAVATSPTTGNPPLTVSFDGSGSIPAQPGDTLTYAWDLDGDGNFNDSTLVAPSYVYNTPGVYNVRLKVTDQRGGSAISDPIPVTVGAVDPVATVDTPPSTLTWKVGDLISFSGHAVDPQEGMLPAADLSWTIIIHHCPSTCHTHIYETFAGVASGSFNAPDHEYPSWLEIQLTAMDSVGNVGMASVNIQPQTVDLTMQSVPTGLQLTAGTTTGAAPYVKTVIVNSQTGLDAPSPQGTFPTVWEWASWSDGGAQSHTIVAPVSPVSFTATYENRADLSLAMGAPGGVCVGQNITYTLTVTNAGLSRASAITLLDTLPTGATLVSATGSTWSCSGTAIVTCTLPSLDIASAPPVTIVITPAPGTNSAFNTANVSSSVTDANPGNNTATATTAIGELTAPVITVVSSVVVGATGIDASVPLHAGSSYAWTITGGTITGGQGTSAITFDAGGPGTTMSLSVVESGQLCDTLPGTAKVQVDFSDVPPGNNFHDDVDIIARDGITVGCGDGNYCPDENNSRAQMAVFLEKSKFGADYVPPPATGLIFADVHVGDFAADWIEDLYNRGITGGCQLDPLLYCPDDPVTRAQMAVFLLKMLLGTSYVPPPPQGLFVDVPIDYWAAAWIEDFYGRGITAGCSMFPLKYCPDDPNTRGQMSAFLVLTFGLQ
jgi:uncharacterized repeat protein (TIGR01451 family)